MNCKKCLIENLKPEELVIIIKGTQKGLYCAVCGAWLKWISKDEFNKYKIQGVKIIAD